MIARIMPEWHSLVKLKIRYNRVDFRKDAPLFEITFLGTSASAPSPKRNLPAYLVQHDEHRFLVDCGEGTQRQIL